MNNRQYDIKLLLYKKKLSINKLLCNNKKLSSQKENYFWEDGEKFENIHSLLHYSDFALDGIKLYDKAIKLNPNNYKVYRDRAWLKFRLNQYEEAIEDYNIYCKSFNIHTISNEKEPDFIRQCRFNLKYPYRIRDEKITEYRGYYIDQWNRKASQYHIGIIDEFLEKNKGLIKHLKNNTL